MLKKNVEVFHQGFLIKSPPSPLSGGLIFKARWRRRFFTLKQGELPAQFFLEYYTDESCRKRKGIVDLDQVEQIDAGLRLDKQSVQYQHIFDIVTPHRTYYLAAETEKEMKDWVMVICQVCNLQEAEEKSEETSATAQYYNLISHPDFEAKVVVEKNETSTSTAKSSSSGNNTSTNEPSHVSSRFDSLSIVNEYENDNVAASHSSFQSNKTESMLGSSKNYSNLSAISISQEPKKSTTTRTVNKSTGAIKKIPKSLDLMKDDKINNNNEENSFRHSGPYIPLSDCFSGSPVFFKSDGDPKTPLNSLDPRFYETPKSHQTNIGLNLTDDQKDIVPSSPKRNNVPSSATTAETLQKQVVNPGSITPTDEECFSTDEEDEWRTQKLPGKEQKIPFTTSADNVAIIATQCYMKVSASNPLPLPPKRMSFIEKKNDISDSEENISPIGPRDRNCGVSDERYDIPRSYQLPARMHHRSTSLITSTPNLVSSPDLNKSELNFYSNFAPSEHTVFRFDGTPPVVNRTLKPGNESNSTNSLNAPKVDRKLKPVKMNKSSRSNTLNSKDIENSMPCDFDDTTFFDDSMTDSQTMHMHSQSSLLKNDEKLQYLDLDHDSPPKSSLIGSVASIASHQQMMDISINGSIKENPGINYTTVDFLKTDAFNRLREDSEMIRASKSKHKK